jgi:GlcNAc-P-P-Und epimerase
MKKHILITGCTGFIGSYFNKRLKNEGWHVKGIDLKVNKNQMNNNLIEGNILNKDVVKQAMEGSHVVLHLAAKHRANERKEDYYETNVAGTKAVLDVATELNIHNIIFFSTVNVYGNNNLINKYEDLKPEPVDDYGKSKLMAEHLIQEWLSKNNLNKALIMRPVVVYGKNNYGNMYRLIDFVYRNNRFQIATGKNKKAIAYVENLFDAVMFAWYNMDNRKEVYNYSDYPIMTTSNLINLIYKYLEKKKPRLILPLYMAYFGGYLFDLIAAITKKDFQISKQRIIKFYSNTINYSDRIREKGYNQKYTNEYGIFKMVNWYKEKGC